MFHFLPPKHIERFQKHNYRSFEDIPEKEFNEIRAKLQKLQSSAPLATIGLIAFNEQDYILSTLASLAETISRFPLELIVVNNNSTDNTQKFLDRCGVRSISETSQGYAFARQAALSEAKGKYFISGDTDTIYTPYWAERMISPMEKDQNIVCTYSLHAFYTDEQKYPLSLQFYQYAKLMSIYSRNVSRPQLNCGGASMAFRTEVARKFGGYNTDIKRGSDGYIALQLSQFGKIAMVPDQKAVIYTNMRRTKMDGSLMSAFSKRFRENAKYFFTNFTRQKDK